jgi:uncharacterized protein YjbI with pentapeptide repeats
MGADPGNQPMGVMRSNFEGANLQNAVLTNANLSKADLTRADLTGADLTGADLAGVNLTQTVHPTVKGRAQAKNFDKALNADKAITK